VIFDGSRPMNDNSKSGLLGTDVDARIAQLSPAKRALLRKRLSGGGEDPGHRQIRSPLSDERNLELSYAQQRLWFLQQWEGGGALYNIGRGWWLQGPLDVARLREAVTRLIARHDSLRTVFLSTQGQPQQQVLADLAVELPLVDLGALPAEQARAQALAQALALARQGFDLTQAPLLRLALIRVAESTHLLVLVIHHIISDGWSMRVFCRELAALYAGKGEQLPALPVQYLDYAQWQRADLQRAALERQLAYWRARLAGLTTLALPIDRPRPPAQSHRGARHALALSADLSAALKQLSQGERVTLYMLLLAAFQVLLARYSGQDDIAVGSPIAGRTRLEFEGLIGFFVNTLVLRTDLSGNPRFRDLLARVREGALDAYAHQEVPFEKLVEELNPERDVSHNPLIQAMFALQNAPGGELTLPGLEVTVQALDTPTAKFDLTLTLSEGPAGLGGTLEYATDLFDAATIARMAAHFTTLLEGIVAHPETPIAQIPLLTPAERHQLLEEWNDTAADYPKDRCIHQLFDEQAARTPRAVAVVFEDQQLTYGELNARANQLAHYLRSKGVGPDVLVGLCLERSPELLVGILGILKAGGAYVPLDPAYPAQRLAFMLVDAAVPVLLTQHPLRDTLPPTAAMLVCLDAAPPELQQQPTHNPTTLAHPHHLAYVIYTSGSTGTPKGVMIEHRSLLNYVVWLQHDFPLAPSDRMLQSTPTSFDISILELFWPLLAGAPLEIAPPGAHRSANELIDLVRRREITVLQVVPNMLGAIIEEGGLTKLESLRRVFTAGEALGADLVRRFHTQSAAELVNGYGPTETTVYSTFWRCDPVDARPVVPIGRPLANTRVWILDAHGAPVPVGVAGEIYLAGDGVARGYLGRSDLTARRFVPDPFAADAHARMYRTGDRARYLPDGNIEFLGRLDTQVKLRGFRIELGEIEAVLAQQPQVHEAAVIVREDVPGEKRLVAYVVARGDAIAAADLRAFAKQLLPDYMLPAAFVLLPALPLMPNGKVDRSALPAPAYQSSEPGHEPPRTPMERALAKAMAEVLNQDRVGLNDNFFELGGHSLLAVQLMNRIRHDLNIDLSLRQLFETPTVSGLALAALDNMVPGATDRLLSPRA